MEILGSLILSVTHSILFYGKEIGISMILFTILGNVILYYILSKKNKIINKKGFILLIPIVLISFTYFIYANTTLQILNIFALLILNIIMYSIVVGEKNNALVMHLYSALEIAKNTIEDYLEVIKYSNKKVKEHIKIGKKLDDNKIKRVGMSLLIVLGVCLIIVILLASADSIFAGIFSNIGNAFSKINIGTFILRIGILIVVYFLILSYILNLQKKIEFKVKKQKKANEKYILTIKLLLVALNVIYLVFCFIQVQSLFAKANLNENFNYAEYAKAGFFQLMFVSFINLIIILISDKYNVNKEKSIKILNLFLVIFTCIIAISSMYRMHMYEMEYGLTYLRVFVYIILATEIISFVPIIIHIFNEKFDFIKWCFIILICIYCGINYINIEKIIVNNNINRKTSKQPIDYNYIHYIASADSYDILEEKLKNENLSQGETLFLKRILLDININSKDMNWQEFNISKWNLLKKNIDIEKLNEEVEELEIEAMEQNSTSSYKCIYNEKVSENERYYVKETNTATGSSEWEIIKYDEERNHMNTITVSSASKIKFFENGLGFIEEPTSIYCEKSNLLVTHDSGKTFSKIVFDDGKFTLSNSQGKNWSECYDYYYLPTLEADGTLTVLVSGGYGGGYNQGKTRAKYISKDNGYSWEFVGEIYTK